jgi:hypothetical protein
MICILSDQSASLQRLSLVSENVRIGVRFGHSAMSGSRSGLPESGQGWAI